MLKVLKIKNIALIDDVTINFDKGMNVFTGETGAGKSIIIDSLSFLLGARADKSLIRHGESFARVDGYFDVDLQNENINKFFNDIGLEPEDLIIITRIMSNEGKNEIRVNNNLVTLSMLKSLTSCLVDIYGQNDQLNLLNNKYQLKLIDDFNNNSKTLIDEYGQILSQIKIVNSKLNELGGDDITRQREIGLLKYQVEEIENASISSEEEQSLLEKKQKMQNAEKIASLTNQVANGLDLMIGELQNANNNLESASRFDGELNNLSQRLDSANIEIEDILECVKEYNDNLYFDENEYNQLLNRLDEYNNLKRKYGNSVLSVLDYYNESKQQLDMLQNSSFEIEKLEKEKKELKAKLYNKARQLTLVRKENASKMQELILQNLKNLGMNNAKLVFEFKDYNEDNMQMFSNGCDEVELMFSANKGEEVKPLKDVASGGEMSRFMLALKSVIAQTDDMPTMIFDEIDMGISGLMAQAVAIQMSKIAKNHQVLVITHTVQIASMADTNFLVKKTESETRTQTNVEKLSYEGKIEEISRFLSSQPNSEIALNNAKQLLNEQNEFKNTL